MIPTFDEFVKRLDEQAEFFRQFTVMNAVSVGGKIKWQEFVDNSKQAARAIEALQADVGRLTTLGLEAAAELNRAYIDADHRVEEERKRIAGAVDDIALPEDTDGRELDDRYVRGFWNAKRQALSAIRSSGGDVERLGNTPGIEFAIGYLGLDPSKADSLRRAATVNIPKYTDRVEAKLAAVRIYAEGVKMDFPDAAIWMDNIIAIVNRRAE